MQFPGYLSVEHVESTPIFVFDATPRPQLSVLVVERVDLPVAHPGQHSSETVVRYLRIDHDVDVLCRLLPISELHRPATEEKDCQRFVQACVDLFQLGLDVLGIEVRSKTHTFTP